MHSTNRRLLTLALFFLFTFSLSMMAFAQDATEEPTAEATAEATTAAPIDLNLTYSVAASGEITNSTVSQTWTLTSASADRLMVRVERTSGNLLPDVAILDTSDQQLATSYGSDQTGA